MSDAVFNSFLKSVYGSGTAMHHFDNHIEGGFEVVGGIDDISVASIFGGMHDHDSSSDSGSDSDGDSDGDSGSDSGMHDHDSVSDDSDSGSDGDGDSDNDNDSDKTKNCKCDSNCKSDCNCECGCGDKKKMKVVGSGDVPMVSGMNIDLNSCTTPNTLIGSISLPIASIEPQSKAIGSGYQGLTARDVSSMIQNYR